MENLTPWQIAVIVCGALLTAAGFVNQVGSAVERIMKARKAAIAPTAELQTRVEALESWQKEVNGKLRQDYTELQSIQEGNHAIFQALLALLDHGLDGNNVEQMRAAKESLREHLINK